MKNVGAIATIILKKAESKDWDELWKQLVPSSGKCKTVEGELMRALAKIRYRFYNDGDMCTQGYGIETVGSSVLYLEKKHVVVPELVSLIRKLIDISDDGDENGYGRTLDMIEKAILKVVKKHIEEKGMFTNHEDSTMEYRSEAARRWEGRDENPDPETGWGRDEEETDRIYSSVKEAVYNPEAWYVLPVGRLNPKTLKDSHGIFGPEEFNGKGTLVLAERFMDEKNQLVVISGASGHYADPGTMRDLVHDQSRRTIGRIRVLKELDNSAENVKKEILKNVPFYVFK